MINTLLGTKKGMTSLYDSRGRRVGATVVELGPNFVTQIKTSGGKDGYSAVQLAFGEKKSTKKPQIGLLKKIGLEKKVKYLREARETNINIMKVSRKVDKTELVQASSEGLELGKELKVGDIFRVGDAVKVTGVSKGKGFQGGVRRHGFHGGPKTHGQSDRHRAPGAIGTGTTPGRVLRGKKMAGHMGVRSVSYSGLEVVGVDRVNNLMVIKGGVPGPIGSLVKVEKQGKIRGYTPPPEEKEDEEGQEAESAKGEGEKQEEKKEAEQPKEEMKGEAENAG